MTLVGLGRSVDSMGRELGVALEGSQHGPGCRFVPNHYPAPLEPSYLDGVRHGRDPAPIREYQDRDARFRRAPALGQPQRGPHNERSLVLEISEHGHQAQGLWLPEPGTLQNRHLLLLRRVGPLSQTGLNGFSHGKEGRRADNRLTPQKRRADRRSSSNELSSIPDTNVDQGDCNLTAKVGISGVVEVEGEVETIFQHSPKSDNVRITK